MMQVRRSRAKDDLLGWQIAPYAEAVLAQQHSRAILRAAARLQQVSPGFHAQCMRRPSVDQLMLLLTAILTAWRSSVRKGCQSKAWLDRHAMMADDEIHAVSHGRLDLPNSLSDPAMPCFQQMQGSCPSWTTCCRASRAEPSASAGLAAQRGKRSSQC